MTTATTFDWGLLIAASEYDALVAIRDAMREGEVEQALDGLQELIDTVAREKRNAVRSHLRQLMAHVLKWRIQPQRRSRSWIVTILNARQEIEDLQETSPSITDEVILHDLWMDAFRQAKRLAAAETSLPINIASLSWQEVFDEEYSLPVDQ